MRRTITTGIAAIALASGSVAADAARRPGQPAQDSAGIGGSNNTLLFLAGIAAVALAIAFLPEDQPVSP